MVVSETVDLYLIVESSRKRNTAIKCILKVGGLVTRRRKCHSEGSAVVPEVTQRDSVISAWRWELRNSQ